MNPVEPTLPAGIYIIGGSPCSGKSSIAEHLATEYQLQVYKADDYEDEHPKRTDPQRHPVMTRYKDMGWNEIWSVPTAQAVRDLFAYYRERFALGLQDLAAFDPACPMLAEGFPFLPELIQPLGVDPAHAIFLVPTYDFQLQYYSQRTWVMGILAQCARPQEAFANWMRRDYLSGREILRQAQALGYRCVEVDGSLSLEEMTALVREHFGLGK